MELRSLVLAILALLVLSLNARAEEVAGDVVVHVCEAGDPLFLGEYALGSEKMDGAPVYSNSNDMSFFRNKGFWYLGNLGPWPPETHYRCVEAEGCNPGGQMPPTTAEGAWSASKRFGKTPVPVISTTPCSSTSGGSSAADEL